MVEAKQNTFSCVIPCGGNSSRMGGGGNKTLIEVNGKSLLQHVVEFWRGWHIENFIFIVSGDGLADVASCVATMHLDRKPVFINRGDTTNLALALSLANPYIDEGFVLALGDCVQSGVFKTTFLPDFGCGVCSNSSYELRKSYLVEASNGVVTKLTEKPDVDVGLCGMGTWFLPRRIFEYIARMRLKPQATSVDLTGALQLAIKNGERLRAVHFEGDYINVTYPDDIRTAQEILS